MLRSGIIKQLFPERTGVNKRTNEPWVFTPILFEWKEDVGKVEPETHSAIIDLKGKKNTERINLAIVKQECIPLELYFNANTYQRDGEKEVKGFNSVRGYIGKEFEVTL